MPINKIPKITPLSPNNESINSKINANAQVAQVKPTDQQVVRLAQNAINNPDKKSNGFFLFFKKAGKWFRNLPSKITNLFKKCFHYKVRSNIPLAHHPLNTAKTTEHPQKQSPFLEKKTEQKVQDQKEQDPSKKADTPSETTKEKQDLPPSSPPESTSHEKSSQKQIADSSQKETEQKIDPAASQKQIEKQASPEQKNNSLDAKSNVASKSIDSDRKKEPEDVKSGKQEIVESQKNQKIILFSIPPNYVWKKNSCWFHASLQCLGAWQPYFSDLITKKIHEARERHKAGEKFDEKEIHLLGALKIFNNAMQSQKLEDFRKAASNILKATQESSRELSEKGKQHDAGAFFDFILEYLSKPLFQIQTTRQGVGEVWQALEQNYQPEDHFLLKLNFYGKNKFQEILNENFTRRTEKNNKTTINDVSVDHYTEKQKILGPPPEFIFVRMYREATTTKQEIQQKKDEQMEKKAAQSQTRRSGRRRNRRTAEPAEPIFASQKISTPIEFPEDYKVNLAFAFDAKEMDPDYDYKLKASIDHVGSCLNNGHYTASILDPYDEQQWYNCDDDGAKVEATTTEEAKKNISKGYIYYLEKVKKNNPQLETEANIEPKN